MAQMQCSEMLWYNIRGFTEDTLEDLIEFTERVHTKSGLKHLRLFKPDANLKIISYSQSSVNCPGRYSDGSALALCQSF